MDKLTAFVIIVLTLISAITAMVITGKVDAKDVGIFLFLMFIFGWWVIPFRIFE